MALHPKFPDSPYEILDPAIRWFPADETLREVSFENFCHRLCQNFGSRGRNLETADTREPLQQVVACLTGGLKPSI